MLCSAELRRRTPREAQMRCEDASGNASQILVYNKAFYVIDCVGGDCFDADQGCDRCAFDDHTCARG